MAAADRGVEHTDQVEQRERNGQTGQQSDAEDHHRTRRDRHGAAVGRVDDAGVALRDGEVELRLLLLVEQVEEQLLFDLLLTRDAQNSFFLRGDGRYALVGLCLLLTQSVALKLKGRNMGAQRGEDRGAQRYEPSVEILDYRVIVGCLTKRRYWSDDKL